MACGGMRALYGAADRGMCMNGFGMASASWRDWHVSMCDGKVTCQTESLC